MAIPDRFISPTIMSSRLCLISCYIVLLIAQCPKYGITIDLSVEEKGHPSPVLVLLIDGLRWDLLSPKRGNLSFPGFDKLKSIGGYVERVSPVFPAECHPNIYSIFTGRYPSKHGVIFTTMFDDITNEMHSFNNGQPPEAAKKILKSGDIWDRWHKHNQSMHLYNFPICPSNSLGGDGYCENYVEAMSPVGLNQTIQRALIALRNGSVNIAVVYYDRLDRVGHEFGPFSTESYSSFAALDDIVLSLMSQLETLSLTDKNPVHLVVTSDHGMSEVSNLEDIDRTLSPVHLKMVINRGSTMSIWPKPEDRSFVIHRLQSHNEKFFRLYNRSTIPRRWNTDANMFPELLLVLKPGVLANSTHWPIQLNHYTQSIGTNIRGAHGYDANADEMHIPLFAYGPRIRRGSRYNGSHSVDHVHTHFLLSLLSGIPDVEDDGYQRKRMYDIFHALLSPPLPEQCCAFSFVQGGRSSSIVAIVVIFSVVIMCGLVLLIVCRLNGSFGRFRRSQAGLTERLIFDESVDVNVKDDKLIS